MAIVLLTGVVIWWPKSLKMLKNRLSVSTSKGFRRFVYDSHVSLGIYAFVFLFLMALTGPVFSFGWYRQGMSKLFAQPMPQKEMKQKQVKVEVKEIRFGPQTDAHDYQFKLKHAKEFLEEGNKVRAYVFFRGRSILFKEQGEVLLLRFANDLEEFAKVEQLPKLEGKKMFLFLAPKKAGVAKQSQQKRDRLAAEAAARENNKERDAEEAEKKGLLNNAKGAEALLKLKGDSEE